MRGSMLILNPIQWFGSLVLGLADEGHSVMSAALPFSPIKLTVLIVWVYICVYLVQFVQFSPLVPKQYKPAAYIGMLLAGPVLFLVLVVIDAAKKSGSGSFNFFESIRHYLGTVRYTSHKDPTAIQLFDSSGRNINEIYGHSQSKRQAKRILSVTEEIVSEALEQRASDILIDGRDESVYTIRFRIDGVLHIAREMPTETCKAVLNSIKAVSSMDISEKRRPQDGAFMAKKEDMTASFRVASAGALMGEKLSVRVLNQNAGALRLRDVGITKKQYVILQKALKQPAGMILMCGPTGSGKTTTLYAMLNEIDRSTRNVITVEDPIEAMLPNASQLEVNTKAGITFAKVLRSILRQDPDVICVGEIRDEETAEIALRAAQTGHLVLATIHCDSNASAVVRLLDLDISSVLMASGLSLLISQRLVRKLCKQCKRPARLSESLKHEFQDKKIDCSKMFEAVGCEACRGTGYSGRTAICDPMVVTDDVKSDIAENKLYVAELRSKGNKQGKVHLRREGLKRVAAGITSLDELKRVVG